MKNILNFKDIINLYDGFIFDQFGVIHNGLEINSEIEKSIIEIKNKKKNFTYYQTQEKQILKIIHVFLKWVSKL